MIICITSDNHLGYKQHDPILSQDSFTTFDEILSRAQNADLILQCGDLFHHNTPSKQTLHKTLTLLKKYCLGESDVEISSPSLNINSTVMNVKLPMIIINGNHDDPSGSTPTSAIDILDAAGLVNYIGRVANEDQNFILDPVIVHKGEVKVAIYGIGYLPDKRIFDMIADGNLEFKRVPDDYYCIFMMHQNLYRGYCILDILPDWLDLILCGHEHEPIIKSESPTIIQCGSSVRTSLCDGEMGDKYMYEITLGDEVKIKRIKLNTVRYFMMKTVKNEDNIQGVIDNMLEEYNNYKAENDDKLLPLLRLRIYNPPTINLHVLAQTYSTKIANIKDMFLIQRNKKIAGKDVEKISGTDIYTILKDNLKLQALPENLMLHSLKQFVDSNNKDAFDDMIACTLKRCTDRISGGIGDEVIRMINIVKDQINKEFSNE